MPLLVTSCLTGTIKIKNAPKKTEANPEALFNPAWTWISGSSTVSEFGSYGTKGFPDPSNFPGGRGNQATWIDKTNNIWIFGGYGNSSSGVGFLNDLWKWDGTNWTWVSGHNETLQSGAYGVKGVTDPNNIPGARSDAAQWIDNQGNFWIFGGFGRGPAAVTGSLNDLWKFDGSNWTWVSGTSALYDAGSYGTKGVAAPSNLPPHRSGAASWTDSAGNFWLFGGSERNDLWKWDGTNWTWVSGGSAVNQPGVYGTKGVANPGNVPGTRNFMAHWVDSSGNFWLFGGSGRDSTNTPGKLNDLWKFDGTNWTWVAGSNLRDQNSVYGVRGVADGTNSPGGRTYSSAWIDSDDVLWLFAGEGYDSEGSMNVLNDLWKYDGVNWTWISGSEFVSEEGEYGNQGVASEGNRVGAKFIASGVKDSAGTFWLFGGRGPYPGQALSGMNDLWRLADKNFSYSLSSISATGPISANGVSNSTVTITLKKNDGTYVVGVTPTFNVSGSGNTIGNCSATNESGVSQCSLTSTQPETKSLSITYPIAKPGKGVIFF